MDTALLRKAGLTESQAKGYFALIEHGALSPADLAEKTGESRTNGYMICEKLEQLGLATKKEGKKSLYTPNHPSALEALAEKRRKAVTRNEQEVKQGISPLIDLFYKSREEPGARTLQGIDGLKEVFADILRTGKDVYLLRTAVDAQALPVAFFEELQDKKVALGIHTYLLAPLDARATQAAHSNQDVQTLTHRTFYPNNIYTEPVELQIYGDKVAFIAYGETQMATIITSPLIAAAMQQLHSILQDTYKDVMPPDQTVADA